MQSWAVFEILVFEIRILNTFSILYLVSEILTVEYFVFWYFKYFFSTMEVFCKYCIQNTFSKYFLIHALRNYIYKPSRRSAP